MTTVTVPKKKYEQLMREEKLVLIPQEEYDALLRIKMQGIREITLTPSERRAVAAGKKELRSGKYFNLDELESYLDRTRARARR
jgi:hypothetical protein